MQHGGKREGAGRKPGSLDSLKRDQRGLIEVEQIIVFLNDLACGREVDARIGNRLTDDSDDFYEGMVKGTIEQRMKAADILLKKALPDLKAVEHAPAAGTRSFTLTINAGDEAGGGT